MRYEFKLVDIIPKNEWEPWSNGKVVFRVTYRSRVRVVEIATNTYIRIGYLYHTPKSMILLQILNEYEILRTSSCFFTPKKRVRPRKRHIQAKVILVSP